MSVDVCTYISVYVCAYMNVYVCVKRRAHAHRTCCIEKLLQLEGTVEQWQECCQAQALTPALQLAEG